MKLNISPLRPLNTCLKKKTISSYDVHFDVKNVKCHKWDIASGAVDCTGWLWWINNQYDNLCEA